MESALNRWKALIQVNACEDRLEWESTRALGATGGSGGVHDECRSVVRDVDERVRLALFADQVLVIQAVTLGGGAYGDGDVDTLGRGSRSSCQRSQRSFGDNDFGAGVVYQISDLGWCQTEVHRNSDGAQCVGREHDLEVLGAVEHQDEHAVAEADAASGKSVRQLLDACVEGAPGDGIAQESQCGAIGNHLRMPGDLIVPVGAA